MKAKLFIYLTFLFTSLLFFHSEVKSQAAFSTAPPYNNVQYLVENVLLGSGVQAFNFQIYGDPMQYGFFSGLAPTIGLDSGIILSSGHVLNTAIGVNLPANITNVPGVSGQWGPPSMGTAASNDLLTVAQSVPPLINQNFNVNSANDACVLEFDFVPTSDTIEFRYVFGSNEYLTYVNTSFNDIFAFFLSGPGITGPFSSPAGFPGGSINLAVVPGSIPPLPISISSVNNVLNAGYYNHNIPNLGINVNGYTAVFTARAIVSACDTFHIRLAIADGSDKILDSWVFLEANSFSSSGLMISAKPNYVPVGGNDSVLYEGCSDVTLTLKRGSNIPNADTVALSIGGTAINGVDYSLIPDTIIFPPGVDSISIIFTVFNDSTIEGPETITISVTNFLVCSSQGDSITLTIVDPLDLTLSTSNDTTVRCTVNNLNVKASVSGLTPYSFVWSNGALDSTFNFNPSRDTVFYVTVTDGCFIHTKTDSVKINIYNPPYTLTLADDTIDCTMFNRMLHVTVDSNFSPQMTYLWSTGHTGPTIFVSPRQTTTYYVTVSLPCSGQQVVDSSVVVVDNPPFTLIPVHDTIDCTVNTAQLSVQIGSGFRPGFSYIWNTGSLDSTIVVSPNGVQTTYQVRVTDGCGITTDTAYVTVFIRSNIINVSVNSPTFNCKGDSVSVIANVSGGIPGYRYWWSNGATTQSIIVNPTSTTFYTVTVTDTCGMDTVTRLSTVILKSYPPFSILQMPNIVVNCAGDSAMLGPPTISGGSGDFNISWTNFADMFPTKTVIVDTTALYKVSAYDKCTQETTTGELTVTIRQHPPLELFVIGKQIICEQGTEVIIAAEVTGGAGDYNFKWSNGSIDSIIKVSPYYNSTYAVSVTDACGKGAYALSKVIIISPKADFVYQYQENNLIKYYNRSSDDVVKVLWKFGDGGFSPINDPEYTFHLPGEYTTTLIVENEFGCKDSMSVPIDPPLIVYIPNAFTPNNDGLNDGFQVIVSGYVEYEFFIFNRWGQQVFHSTNPNDVWYADNIPFNQSNGMFAYRLYVYGHNKQTLEKIGNILIIK
jgi:gliding motility-associated-like protein